MKCKNLKQHKKHVNINKIKNICNKADVDYTGILNDENNTPCLVLFNDKAVHSTHAIKIDEFSYNNVIDNLKVFFATCKRMDMV